MHSLKTREDFEDRNSPAAARPDNVLYPQFQNSSSLRVLLIEDSYADVLLFKKMLADASALDEFMVTDVPRLTEALHSPVLAAYDAIVVDLSLPDSCGVDSIIALQALAPGVPVVVYTGASDKALHQDAKTWGAVYVMIKGRENDLHLRHILEEAIVGGHDF